MLALDILRHSLLVVVLVCGCGSSPGPLEDAGADAGAHDALVSLDAGRDGGSDGGSDAGSDAGNDGGSDASTCTTTLLTGGADVAAQGWTVVMQAPATLTYGADYVELSTSTTTGATTSGQLLLSHPGALTAGAPFRLRVEMLVQRVDVHNPLDSAAAILGSFTAPAGTGAERAEMLYLDAAAMGWGDNAQSFAASITDGAYHTYEIAVDAASVAHVSIDGAPALMRSGFASNGTIAIGDQTNDPHVDATLRIRSVTLLCP